MDPIVDAVVYVITPEGGTLSEWAGILYAAAAIFSVLIACLALWYSRQQVKMHERHNRLMATPNLSGWKHTDSEQGTFLYTLENTGIGPAIIKEITLEVDGKLVEGEGSDLIEAAIDIIVPYEQTRKIEMFVKGEFISAGRRVEIYQASSPYLSEEEIEERLTKRAKLLIQYESIFGDAFTFDSSKG